MGLGTNPDRAAFAAAENNIIKYYTNADYAVGGIQLDNITQVVDATPGSGGALAFKLPLWSSVPIGHMISVLHHGGSYSATLAPHHTTDGIFAWTSPGTMSADNDRITVISTPLGWATLVDVTAT